MLICQTLVNPRLKPLCDMLPNDYSQGLFVYFLYLYVNFLSKSSSKGPKVIKVQTTPWLEVVEEEEVEVVEVVEEVEAEEVEVVVEEEA